MLRLGLVVLFAAAACGGSPKKDAAEPGSSEPTPVATPSVIKAQATVPIPGLAYAPAGTDLVVYASLEQAKRSAFGAAMLPELGALFEQDAQFASLIERCGDPWPRLRWLAIAGDTEKQEAIVVARGLNASYIRCAAESRSAGYTEEGAVSTIADGGDTIYVKWLEDDLLVAAEGTVPKLGAALERLPKSFTSSDEELAVKVSLLPNAQAKKQLKVGLGGSTVESVHLKAWSRNELELLALLRMSSEEDAKRTSMALQGMAQLVRSSVSEVAELASDFETLKIDSKGKTARARVLLSSQGVGALISYVLAGAAANQAPPPSAP